MLCDLLGVSPSGYYRSRQQQPGPRQREDAALTAQITAAHRASRGTYGVPRIVEDLRAAGTRTSKRRCARLMQAEGLRGKKKHCRRPRTTDSRHAQPIAASLIAGMNLVAVAPRIAAAYHECGGDSDGECSMVH